MSNFIKFPMWIEEITEIKSNLLKNFFEKSDIDNEKTISLGYLRKLYKLDIDKFNEVITELSLRGFEFHSDKPSNLFPQIFNELDWLIVSNEESDITKLEFKELMLGNIIDRFQLYSNDNYDYIPLEGFKVLNPYVKIEDLKQMFLSANFNIINKNEKNKNKTIDNEKKYVRNNSLRSEEELNDLMMIDTVFNENKYLLFRKFCVENSIKTILDIKNTILLDFVKYPKSGNKKVECVKKKLESIYDKQRNRVKYSPININFIFWQQPLECIREYCNENRIDTINNIKDKHINEIRNIKNMNIRKMNILMEKIDSYKEDELEEIEYKFIQINDFWRNKLSKYKIIYIITILGYNYQIDDTKSLKDLEDMVINDLSNKELTNIYYNVSSELNRILPIKELIETAINTIDVKENRIEAFRLRYKEGLTLEEIGSYMGVTRERVRQIVKEYENKFINSLMKYNFIKAFKLFFIGYSSVSIKEFNKFFSKENYYYRKSILSGIESMYYCEDLEEIFFRDISDELKALKKYLKGLPELFKLEDYIEEIKEYLKNIELYNVNDERVEIILINYGFEKNGEYLSRGRVTLTSVVDVLFKEYIEEPLRIDEEGLKILKAITKKYFAYEIVATLRSVQGCIGSNSELLLVDRLSFIHKDNLKLKENYLSVIEDILNEGFIDGRKVINAETLFKRNKRCLVSLGIYNKQVLYSLIKYHLDDEYQVGKGNSLDIYKDNNVEPMSREDILKDLLEKENGSCTKEKILRVTNWKKNKLEDTISLSNKFIRAGNKVMLIDYIDILEDEKEEIRKIINKYIIREGGLSSYIVFRDIMFNNRTSNILQRNNIKSKEELSGILKYIDNELRGNTLFLYKENGKYTKLESLIMDKFQGVIDREDLYNYIKKYGCSEMYIRGLMKRQITPCKFIELDYGKFIRKEEFLISEEAINSLLVYIKDKIGDLDYISLSELKGYRRELKPIGYKWTAHLMKSILLEHGYREISRVYSDRRYEKVIVVKEKSRIQSYADLICKVIKEEYKGNMHEVKIYEFLEEKCLVYKQNEIYDKKIPYDLIVSEKVIVDEYGRVEIKE